MVQVKWAMRCLQFRLLQAEPQRQLQLAQITHARCWTMLKCCVGATMHTVNLVKETWTTLAMASGQPLLHHQQLI
jgi:hypothetical protein